jgi:hypothetical protein
MVKVSQSPADGGKRVLSLALSLLTLGVAVLNPLEFSAAIPKSYRS